jgi:hypothetical protein
VSDPSSRPHLLRRWGWVILIAGLVLVGILLSLADTSARVAHLYPIRGQVAGSPPVVTQRLETKTLRFDNGPLGGRLVFEPFIGLGPLSPVDALRIFLSNGAGLVLLALAALILFPTRARNAVERFEGRYGAGVALGAGLVMVLLAAAATTLLRFTLLFLGLVPLVLLSILIASLFGIACISLAIGRLLHRRLHLPDVHPLIPALVGALVVFDLAVIPYAGVFALGAVAVAGLGLAVVTRFGSAGGWSFGDLNW